MKRLNRDEIKDLLPIFESKPHLAIIHNMAVIEMNNFAANHRNIFFSFRKSSTIFFAIQKSFVSSTSRRPILVVANESTLPPDLDDVTLGLEKLSKIEDQLSSVYLTVADSILTETVFNFFQSKFGVKNHQKYPTLQFYVPKNRYQSTLETKEEKLAEPFTLESTDPNDYMIINKTWIHSSSPDGVEVREMLTSLPSACVYHQRTPVSFEMISFLGLLSHLFTFPEYRNMGLGTIVERELARRSIRAGLIPTKCVELPNKKVLERSMKDTFWSTINHDNQPLIIDFTAFS